MLTTKSLEFIRSHGVDCMLYNGTVTMFTYDYRCGPTVDGGHYWFDETPVVKVCTTFQEIKNFLGY